MTAMNRKTIWRVGFNQTYEGHDYERYDHVLVVAQDAVSACARALTVVKRTGLTVRNIASVKSKGSLDA